MSSRIYNQRDTSTLIQRHGLKTEWEPIEFETMPYKNTGTSLVKGLDEIIALLDDQVSRLRV
jgi:hypothetical protein